MFSLGFFGSHNSNIAIAKNDTVLEVVELERFISKKNAAFYFYYMVQNPIQILHEIKLYFEKKYGVTEYEVVVHNSVANNAEKIFPAKRYVWLHHHVAHAYSGFYQSPYDKALVISFDGGSDEGFFNAYLADRNTGIEKVYTGNRDYAVPYMVLAHHLSDIKHEQLHWGNLVYAGKLMGYAGYGVVDQSYIQQFVDLYNAKDSGNIDNTYKTFQRIFNVSPETKFSGQLAQNMAATNQYVFEQLFEEEISPLLYEYNTLPIVLVGGCALNIINNTRLARYRDVFVPPNPSDCGLGIGLVASEIKPISPIDATYLGQEVWDRSELSKILYENRGTDIDIHDLANYILSGNIVGVVRGSCEHGPRALGNRSIICNPSIENMKDILNKKVKGREWYRPFAPVVRLEDVNKYFEWDRESRWMSFCPVVREEWRDKLKAVTHIDNTARVQTVTREQNQFLYDLLTCIDQLTGVGVLVNTSFNVDGKPILNTYKEALWVMENKELDAVVFENYFIQKENKL